MAGHREPVGALPFVDGRAHLQPGRRERQRAHAVLEVERDPLAVLARVEQLEPGAVPACVVREHLVAGEALAAVPPRRVDHPGGQRLAHLLEQPVHDVHLVDQRAEVAVGERRHGFGVAAADRRLDLLALGALRVLDHLCGHIVAAEDVAGLEVRDPFRVVVDHVDVADARRRGGQLREHLLEGGVVALHVADLDDLPRAVARGDHLVDVGDRQADRLLAEHVQAGVERGQHDLQVRACGRRDQHRVEGVRRRRASASRRARPGSRSGPRAPRAPSATAPRAPPAGSPR